MNTPTEDGPSLFQVQIMIHSIGMCQKSKKTSCSADQQTKHLSCKISQVPRKAMINIRGLGIKRINKKYRRQFELPINILSAGSKAKGTKIS